MLGEAAAFVQERGRFPVETRGDRDEELLATRIMRASDAMNDEQKAELEQLRARRL